MRRIVESSIAGLFVLGASKVIDKYGEVIAIKSIYQTFIIELWFVWVGLLTALLYWFVRDYIKGRHIVNDLAGIKEWIGLLSYKNNYNDLKGKIKFYVKEELEKNAKEIIYSSLAKAYHRRRFAHYQLIRR